MMQHKPNLLILSGIGEAKDFIARLEQTKQFKMTASLAGLSDAIHDSDFYGKGVGLIHGGFGGVQGLCNYITQNKIDALLDFTHPYAAQMKRQAFEASNQLNLPFISYLRPKWLPIEGVKWIEYDDLTAINEAIPPQAIVFQAAGQAVTKSLINRSDIKLIIRQIKPVNQGESGNLSYLPFDPKDSAIKDWPSEAQLFSQYGITHLISKNSGGEGGFAKLKAASSLQIPILMLRRPPALSCLKASDYQTIENWLFSQFKIN